MARCGHVKFHPFPTISHHFPTCTSIVAHSLRARISKVIAASYCFNLASGGVQHSRLFESPPRRIHPCLRDVRAVCMRVDTYDSQHGTILIHFEYPIWNQLTANTPSNGESPLRYVGTKGLWGAHPWLSGYECHVFQRNDSQLHTISCNRSTQPLAGVFTACDCTKVGGTAVGKVQSPCKFGCIFCDSWDSWDSSPSSPRRDAVQCDHPGSLRTCSVKLSK